MHEVKHSGAPCLPVFFAVYTRKKAQHLNPSAAGCSPGAPSAAATAETAAITAKGITEASATPVGVHCSQNTREARPDRSVCVTRGKPSTKILHGKAADITPKP